MAALKDLGIYSKLDNYGRILIKKRQRLKCGLRLGEFIELKEYIDDAGRSFLVLVPSSSWTEDDYLKAAEILNELGEEVPISLLGKLEGEEEE